MMVAHGMPKGLHAAGAVAVPLFLLAVALTPGIANAQETAHEMFETACAACHGGDGAGQDAAVTGFDIPLPDFTDCQFASREPNGDWLAVIHDGGPARAFDRMMPAFREALTIEEMELALDQVRTFCQDDSWPRGELNLPRALVTEKAFPEDEAVFEFSAATEGTGSVVQQIVYERRFGARSQVELVVPFRIDERDSGHWRGGIGDLAIAFKHAFFHSIESGSIFSLAGEVVLPTGHRDKGFGKGVTVFEPFAAFGQLLPRDSFVQFQGGFEIPSDRGLADEAFWRTAVGKTFTEGLAGRAWTPIVEVLGARELESGATPGWDLVPQVQVSLSQRQHVLLNAGVRIPVNDYGPRAAEFKFYVLWDWFDGGILSGW
jgi:hypothetical protein